MLFQKLSRHTKPTWVFFFFASLSHSYRASSNTSNFLWKILSSEISSPFSGVDKELIFPDQGWADRKGGGGGVSTSSIPPTPPPICKQQETQFRDLFFSIIYLLVTSLPPTPPCSTPSPQKLYKLYWPLLHYMYKSFSDALQIELNMSITQWMFV